MKLTVLGKSPAWTDAGGAGSGYLLEEGDTRVLLDAGSGVFAKLRAANDYAGIDAVVISHVHGDHFLDLIPFSYGLTLSPRPPGAAEQKRPRLFAPPGGVETLRAVTSAWGSDGLVEQAFELSTYDPDDTVAVGSLRFRFCEVPHYIRSFAVEVSSVDGGGRITYGSDCGPNEALIEFARDTDLLLIEATLLESDTGTPPGHLTAAEAGEHGRAAGARRVVLTHISDELDQDRALGEARDAFTGPLEIAHEGAVYSV